MARKMRLGRYVFVLGALSVSACSSGPAPVTGPVPAALAASPAEQQLLTTLQPNDTISVNVLREPDLSVSEAVIGDAGTFMMPLVGEVAAAGKTSNTVAQEIQAALAARYLVNPMVTVNVAKWGSRVVTVEGALEEPGMYEFTPGTTLLGAIALGGSPSDNVASLKDIAIFRKIGGEQMVAVYDLRQIRAGQAADPAILPGDRVVVGFSALGQGLENALRALPAVGVFTRF